MKRIKGDRLYVNLGAAQTRKRLQGRNYGVRKVEAADTGKALIIHTGYHLRELQTLFADVLPPVLPDEGFDQPSDAP